MNIRQFLYLCLLAFVVTLSMIIGWRLSDQAMAVIVGVVAGVAASIPTSLLVVWAVLRARAAGGLAEGALADQPAAANPPAASAQPRVIFVHAAPAAAPTAPALPPGQGSYTVLSAYAAPEPTAFNGLPLEPRHFTILGGDVDS
jgi:hypothetical protein